MAGVRAGGVEIEPMNAAPVGNAVVPGWIRVVNHPGICLIWAAMGVTCATVAPIFLLENVKYFGWAMCLGFVLGFVVYAVAFHKLRYHPFVRGVADRRWYQNAMGNLGVAVMAIIVAVTHHNSQNIAIGFISVSGFVFAAVEIAQPVIDFGLLQNFLRLPVQVAILSYPNVSVIWYVVGGLLLVGCTLGQAFLLETFEGKPKPAVQPQPEPPQQGQQAPTQLWDDKHKPV